MKFYTEDEALKEAGTAFLEPHEVQDVAAQVARHCTGVVARALVKSNFDDLKLCMANYERDAREKKALQAWIASSGAIYDPHRKKWLVLEAGDNLRKCPHCGSTTHPVGCCAQDGHGG